MEFLNIAYVSKVNTASLNGSEGTGGNITPIKKITDNKGNEYAYISGQAQRRYLKETLMQLGERITSVDEKGEPHFGELQKEIMDSKKIKNKKEMYTQFCDMDLFGYMFPNAGRRWSPIKVAPMISLQPYKGEYDYLTRKAYSKEGENKSGNIVQVEIDTLNFMRGNILVDVDKIGHDINEYTYDKEKLLEDSEINDRINVFLDAIKYFNGGAKQSRNLEDIAPALVFAISQKTGNPFMLNSISVDKYNNLNIDPIKEALLQNKRIINNSKVGIKSGVFNNEKDIITEFSESGFDVVTVYEALDTLKRG